MFSLDLGTLINSAIAAGESSLSVILVLFYGYACSKYDFLSETGERSISKLCVNLFLPAMLLTDMGSHISLHTLKEFWPLVALPIVMLTITYFLGGFSVRFLNQPLYIVPGMVFNNVVAMPLLLMEAISNSDVLLPLLRDNESIEQALVRAKAYVLLHGIVHNLARFALGPAMLKGSGNNKDHRHSDAERANSEPAQQSPSETTALLASSAASIEEDVHDFLRKRARVLSTTSIDLDETDALLYKYRELGVEEVQDDGTTVFRRRGTLSALFLTNPPSQDRVEEIDPLATGPSLDTPFPVPYESKTPESPPLWRRALEYIEQFLNPAVCSAILAVFIGITPPLHYIFYKNVAVRSSFTQSIKSIGGLYPALQLFALGSKLTAPLKQPVRKSTIILIAIVRFGLAGAISISLVSFMTTHASPNFWPMDPMLNFVLMITPVGPPAITLAAVAEIAGVSPEEVTAVSRTLLYSYAIAPLVAPSVAMALSIAYQIKS